MKIINNTKNHMSDINCPYCEADLDVCHDDGFGYEENVVHQMECPYCQKQFVFQTSVHFSYNPQKADCLNDEPHEWKPSITYPIEFTHMFCTMCEEQRTPTEEEMEKIMLTN